MSPFKEKLNETVFTSKAELEPFKSAQMKGVGFGSFCAFRVQQWKNNFFKNCLFYTAEQVAEKVEDIFPNWECISQNVVTRAFEMKTVFGL